MNIGDNIKKFRMAKKISQKDFAKILDNMPISTLANYENNHREPNIETLVKMAIVLGVEVGELVTGIKKTLSNKLITHTLDCEYLSIGNSNSEETPLEIISKKTQISVEALKDCIEKNKDLSIDEQIRLFHFSANYDDPGFEYFIKNYHDEIIKIPVIYKEVQTIFEKLKIKEERNKNKERITMVYQIKDSDELNSIIVSKENNQLSIISGFINENFTKDDIDSIISFITTMYNIKNGKIKYSYIDNN